MKLRKQKKKSLYLPSFIDENFIGAESCSFFFFFCSTWNLHMKWQCLGAFEQEKPRGKEQRWGNSVNTKFVWHCDFFLSSYALILLPATGFQMPKWHCIGISTGAALPTLVWSSESQLLCKKLDWNHSQQ